MLITGKAACVCLWIMKNWWLDSTLTQVTMEDNEQSVMKALQTDGHSCVKHSHFFPPSFIHIHITSKPGWCITITVSTSDITTTLSLVLYHIVQNPFFYMWVKTSHSAMKEWHPGPVTLQVKSKVHLKALQASESTAPQALTGYGWMALLHVRGVLIPTLNELANGSPFTLTPFPHTFTHQALLAYPLGHRRQGRTAWLAISLIAWP